MHYSVEGQSDRKRPPTLSFYARQHVML